MDLFSGFYRRAKRRGGFRKKVRMPAFATLGDWL
jgi:hypothetical protein